MDPRETGLNRVDVGLITTALASAFCFAFALVLSQFGLRAISPVLGASITLPTTALLFLVISIKTIRWDEWHSESGIIFALVGLVFPVGVTLLTFHSNQKIGPNLTGTLGNLTPLFAIALAVLVLGEAPKDDQWIGIAIICSGVALLFFDGPKVNRGLTFLALVPPLAAAMLRGGVQPLVKMGLTNWPSPLAAATIGYITSAIVISGFVLIQRGDQRLPDPISIAWFAGVGLVNGAAVLLLFIALENGPVIIVAPLVACYPLLTIVLSRLFLKDTHLTSFSLLGILLTVMGIVFLLKPFGV